MESEGLGPSKRQHSVTYLHTDSDNPEPSPTQNEANYKGLQTAVTNSSSHTEHRSLRRPGQSQDMQYPRRPQKATTGNPCALSSLGPTSGGISGSESAQDHRGRSRNFSAATCARSSKSNGQPRPKVGIANASTSKRLGLKVYNQMLIYQHPTNVLRKHQTPTFEVPFCPHLI